MFNNIIGTAILAYIKLRFGPKNCYPLDIDEETGTYVFICRTGEQGRVARDIEQGNALIFRDTLIYKNRPWRGLPASPTLCDDCIAKMDDPNLTSEPVLCTSCAEYI